MADPITLALIGSGIGTLLGGGAAVASALGPKPSAPQMPTAAPPIQNPVGDQSTNKANPQTPSFLAAAATPAANQQSGAKTLLGQ